MSAEDTTGLVKVRTTFHPEDVIEVSPEEATSLRVQGLLTEETTHSNIFVPDTDEGETIPGKPDDVDITDEVVPRATAPKKAKV